MSHHIEPRSIGSYLSGICDHLETYFPDARQNRNSPLVKKTLVGMKKLRSKPIRRKQPLTRKHLLDVENSINIFSSYDKVLFAIMIITGTCGLLQLGELMLPDNPAIRNFRKITLRESVELLDDTGFSFWLPYHKADRLFEGNRIVILPKWNLHPRRLLQHYLQLRDNCFPFHPHLWVTSSGSVPTRSWFMHRLRAIEPDSRWVGQSMRAAAMAEDGDPPEAIQAAAAEVSCSKGKEKERGLYEESTENDAAGLGRRRGTSNSSKRKRNASFRCYNEKAEKTRETPASLSSQRTFQLQNGRLRTKLDEVAHITTSLMQHIHAHRADRRDASSTSDSEPDSDPDTNAPSSTLVSSLTVFLVIPRSYPRIHCNIPLRMINRLAPVGWQTILAAAQMQAAGQTDESASTKVLERVQRRLENLYKSWAQQDPLHTSAIA
ncbi:hypothetical protein BT96DRAFT_1002104 [Gymnopus androsaceus JB14]|uniref:Uncharacterized protein n=1 Tax=Gymnopus androsaceus JB14 TaxID=1447944 RepID=A0A6A4H0D9_9AGAR|nr:hypothetical protein BT96DRAFT_1002104 [Gymnopus androsaceus JB14]